MNNLIKEIRRWAELNQEQFAREIDSRFNHMQWAGKKYIMERIADELKDKLKMGGQIYDRQTLYWTGYVYHRWHCRTGESGKDICRQAPAKTMRLTYLPCHAMSDEMAIDRLKQAYRKPKC